METIKKFINQGNGIITRNLSIILKYNEMFGKMNEHYSEVKPEMCIPTDPPPYRCGDILYAQEIRDILGTCDIVITIMGLGHIPILGRILEEFNPCLINTTTQENTLMTVTSFREKLPDFAGPTFDLTTVAPFYEDPSAKKTGEVMSKSWAEYLPTKK
jgi:hypothetical protein